MTPNPIRTVLSSIRKHQVQCLPMGGQACVSYGAAEFSRDTYPRECESLAVRRPLLESALARDEATLRAALHLEEEREREADRLYWEPLKRELERLRHETRRS